MKAADSSGVIPTPMGTNCTRHTRGIERACSSCGRANSPANMLPALLLGLTLAACTSWGDTNKLDPTSENVQEDPLTADSGDNRDSGETLALPRLPEANMGEHPSRRMPLWNFMDEAIYTPGPRRDKLQEAWNEDTPSAFVVIIAFCVDKRGNTTDLHLSGDDPAPAISAVLLETIASWRFRPQFGADKPSKTCTGQTFEVRGGFQKPPSLSILPI